MSGGWLAAALLALVVGVLFSVRYAWWRCAVALRHPRILMYHMIRDPLPGGRFNKLRVRPAAFERQLRKLVAERWRFAFVSELPQLRGEPKVAALTFDDGYRDNYLAAHPLLLKYGAKATLYLVVDRFGRDWSAAKKAHHDSGELGAEEKLTDDDVRAMLDSGCWELGAHTFTHPLLPSLEPAQRRREVAGAKAVLESQFATAVRSFAYPFGIFEAADVELAASAGYQQAVTTVPGISTDVDADALELKRIKVSGNEGRLAFSLRLRSGRRGLWK